MEARSLVLEQVWNGTINLRIEFGDNVYLLCAYRLSYFPVYYEQILGHFGAVANLAPEAVWLQHGSVPLQWNMPIGLLHDIHHVPSVAPRNSDPHCWVLQLKSSAAENWPASLIPVGSPPTYLQALKHSLINSLKQSCYVVHGNSRLVLSLSEQDTRDLMEAISTHDYSNYRRVTRAFASKGDNYRIPIRVYHAGSSVPHQLPIPKTLHSDASELTSTLSTLCKEFGLQGKLFIQGVQLQDMQAASLADLWAVMRHLDGFLNVVHIPESPHPPV